MPLNVEVVYYSSTPLWIQKHTLKLDVITTKTKIWGIKLMLSVCTIDGKETELWGKLYLPFQTFGKTITSDNLESRHLLTEPTALGEVTRKN